MKKEHECFISAIPGQDTSILRKVLVEKGIRFSDAFTFSVGNPILDTVADKIKRSSFTIAIIEQPDPRITFEMGLAIGLKKPLVVLLSKGAQLPVSANVNTYRISSLTDMESLSTVIDQFIKQLPSYNERIRRKELPKIPHSNIEVIKKYLADVTTNNWDLDNVEFENFTEDIFKKLDINYVRSKFQDDYCKGFDFAIWNNQLNSSLGNPILVETKYGKLSQQTINEAEDELKKSINQAESKTGLLLYLDENNKSYLDNYSIYPLIIRYEWKEFLKDIINDGFEKALLTARNNIVHGKSRDG